MLCWWAWISCVGILETDQLVQDPAGSSAAVVAAAAERAACGGPDVEASVGMAPDVTGPAESGTEREAVEEAAWVGRGFGIVPEQTEGERSVLVVVAAADEPASGEAAWTVEAGELVGTAAGKVVLGSKALWNLAPHHPRAASGEAGKTASPGV